MTTEYTQIIEKKEHIPIASVLMPVYNVEKYIVEAVESVLSQTFTDFELILLDDCSPDGSADIIKTFSDERIAYHRNDENLGLANNLNVGLDMARGKYVVRMDGDDISLPNRLQTQIEFLEANPDIDLCSCGMEMFGKDDKVWIRERNPEQVKITMLFYSPILHASAVWRRESFEKYNLRYRQEAFPAEDYDLWARAVKYCKLVNIPQVLYRYRIHGIQVTKTDDRAELRTREIRLSYLKETLPSLSEKDRENFVNYYLEQKDIDAKNVCILKSIYKKVVSANKKDLFFDEKLLNSRLKKYYQNVVFSQIKKENTLLIKKSLLLELRIQQIIKLSLK